MADDFEFRDDDDFRWVSDSDFDFYEGPGISKFTIKTLTAITVRRVMESTTIDRQIFNKTE